MTKVPPDPTTAWSGIAWRRLAAGDALGTVRSIVRWRGGYIAVGAPVAHGETSSMPVWVSTDGGAWRLLDSQAFGPDAIVLGVGETTAGLVALTLRGGTDQCTGNEALNCWSLARPLEAWTSPDATSWTSHRGPDALLSPMFEGGGLNAPILRSGKPGLLLVTLTDSGWRLALSRDGAEWEVLPANALPAGFQIGDVAAFGDGFVATGQTAGDRGLAAILTSSDGRLWEKRPLPNRGIDASAGSTGSRLVVGPAGLMAFGSDGRTPGTSLWWSSPDGHAWTQLLKYPPLGVWAGEGEGSGLIENGTVVGNGERMLAYRGGKKQVAWTSLDGRSWRPLGITGGPPSPQAEIVASRQLIVLPIGVLLIGDDGSVWLGEPSTG